MKIKYYFPFLILFMAQITHSQVQTGKASFYGDKFDGRKTASGEIFRQSKMTAAHKTLPFGTNVKITNLANNKSVVVLINDRGPFIPGRIIDVSKKAARMLDFIDRGVTDVIVQVLKPGGNEATGENTEMPVAAEIDFFEVESKRIQPKGFAVQIGSFENSVNLIQFSDRIRSSYRKKITIQIRMVQNAKIFSVLVGSFNNRKKAERFRDKITKKFPGSFTVDFSQIAVN